MTPKRLYGIISYKVKALNKEKGSPKGYKVVNMNVVAYRNEEGNVKASVRNNLNDQISGKLVEVLMGADLEPLTSARKTTCIALVEDSQTGSTVYAEISITITDKPLDQENKPRKGKAKEKTETVVPDLF